MGGRGYHKNVKGYLDSRCRTVEYARVDEISTSKIDFIQDVTTPKNPKTPEFANTPNKIYALVSKNGDKIKSITVYDENHEQKYSIHLDHCHKRERAHVHEGFGDERKWAPLTNEHKKLVEEVATLFDQRSKKLC